MKTLSIYFFVSILGSPETSADELSNFNITSIGLEKRYEDFDSLETKKFEQNKENVLKKWDEIAVSSNKVLVKLYDNNNIRLIVDYENGEVNLEAIGKNKIEIRTLLNELISDKGIYDSILSLEELENEKLTKAEYLNNLMNKIKVDKSDSDIGKRSNVNFSMISGHIKIRAKRYVHIVKKWAHLNNTEPELVMAMIRQESAFNPRAESHIPAYGLMQIVPKYAGQDVLRQLNGRDERPTRNSLFDPEINVMFGTSYIKILSEKFRGLTVDKSQLEHLVVASYNWGPDRILKAIKSKKINLNNPDLYEQIRKIAPEETKEYLKKVRGYKKEFAFKE